MISIAAVIIIVLLFLLLYGAVLWLLFVLENYRTMFDDPVQKRNCKLTIVIPVYNGEATIERCIDSCLALKYPKNLLKIIVVNDASTDNTKKICSRYVREKKITLISKRKNAGKAAALNTALQHIKSRLFMCLDVDSFLKPDMLKYVIGYFDDPKIAAVTMNLKAKNEKNILEKIQFAEYLFCLYLRKVLSFINSLYVIPGPGSVYRTSVVREVGCFDETAMAEDMEIAFRLQVEHYSIESSLNAQVWTIVPSKLSPLIKQRVRWYAGYFQNLKKYKKVFFNRKFGDFGVYLIPFNFVSLFSIFFSFYIVGYHFARNLYITARRLYLTNFDFMTWWTGWWRPQDFFFNLDTIFTISLLLSSIAIILAYLSTILSKEETQLKKRFPHYFLYLTFYFPLLTIFWLATAAFTIKNWRNFKQWRGASLK